MKKYHYTYYSYEEFGRGYIGKRSCDCLPEEDVKYFGSFSDKTFKPTQKIILETYKTTEEANLDEEILHVFFNVALNPHFVNKYNAGSKFYTTPEESSKIQKRYWQSLTPEERSEKAKKRWEKITPEQRSEIARRSSASRTPEQRSDDAKKRWKNRTPEQKSEFSKKRWENKTSEQRSEFARKLNEKQTTEMRKIKAQNKTPEQRSEIAKKRDANMSPEERSERTKKGWLNVSEDKRKERATKASHSRGRWQCTETGHISNAGALSQYQKARGIDTSNRIRIS
jgi:hypothetical protein